MVLPVPSGNFEAPVQTVADIAEFKAARFERVLDAVISLADRGGYDELQLRAIASRSGVSVRTIYKYFGSRDDLITAALIRWRKSCVARTEAVGDNFVDRVLSIYRFDLDQFRSQPGVYDAFIRHQQAIGQEASIWGRSSRNESLARELNPFGEEFAADFLMMVRGVTAIHHIRMGTSHFDELWDQIERTVRRLARSK